jgi:hypothetical protein
MGPLILAWMVGEGIISYREVTKNHRPPLPAEILASSGVFVLLGLLAQAQPKLASLLAWGFDLAAFMNLAPSITGGSGSNPAPGTTNGAGGTSTPSGNLTTGQGIGTPVNK